MLNAFKKHKNIKLQTGLPVNSVWDAKFGCQRWNTISLKVTWRRTRKNIKNRSG